MSITWHKDGNAYVTCKPGCVEGHRHYIFSWKPCAPEPEPFTVSGPAGIVTAQTPDPADFASLLEREPQPERTSERERCARELEEYGYPNSARLLRNGPDDLDERVAKAPIAKMAIHSAQERIQALEGVLRAIRVGAVGAENYRHNASMLIQKHRDTVRLIRETLDPHQPWCRDENHQGPCEAKDEGYEGERDE